MLNATEARQAIDAKNRAIVVTGDEPSRAYWATILGGSYAEEDPSLGDLCVIAERGLKGNFLGALQAYQRVTRRRGTSTDGSASFDQIVMLVGSGTRLSPITQSLRNMKAALVLPDGDAPVNGFTVGEAALRSTAPWIRALKEGGFDGIVVRWGDEVIVPSTVLESQQGSYADVDAVRFGYRATPTELLASQKEWLVSDEHLTVHAELPRQSVQRLTERMSAIPSTHSLHINLGSFAASHELLASLTLAFETLLDDASTSANWDPYLWIALHSESEEEWEAACCVERGVRPPGFATLLTDIPDFWRRAKLAKEQLRSATGRPLRVTILDFGDPYWFDAGNHSTLRAGLEDIFRPGRDGDTIRALLGLSDAISEGGSHIVDSHIAHGAVARNSVVIGSCIEDANSNIDGAIVVNSRVGSLTAGPGATIIECSSETLVVDGPEGLAFRIRDSTHIAGDEISATVGIPPDTVRLSHYGARQIVDDVTFRSRLPRNAISFLEASVLAAKVDPLKLRSHWLGVRGVGQKGGVGA